MVVKTWLSLKLVVSLVVVVKNHGSRKELAALVQERLDARAQARADKDFATADAIRDQLTALLDSVARRLGVDVEQRSEIEDAKQDGVTRLVSLLFGLFELEGERHVLAGLWGAGLRPVAP